MRAPLWISQPLPIVVRPSRNTQGCRIVSGPIVTSLSMSRGVWIFDRDAGVHELCRFFRVAHDGAHRRQLAAAVDASNLVRIRDGNEFRPSGPACR